MALNLKLYILDPASQFGRVDSPYDLIDFAKKRNRREASCTNRIRPNIITSDGKLSKMPKPVVDRSGEFQESKEGSSSNISTENATIATNLMDVDTEADSEMKKICTSNEPSKSQSKETELNLSSMPQSDPVAAGVFFEACPTNDLDKCGSICEENIKKKAEFNSNKLKSPIFKRLDWGDVHFEKVTIGKAIKFKDIVKYHTNDDEDILIIDTFKSVKNKSSVCTTNLDSGVNGEDCNDNLNDTGESSSSGSGHSKRYTDAFKLEVSKFMLKHSAQEAYKRYGIARSTAKRWKKIYISSNNSSLVAGIIDDVIFDIVK